MALKVKYSVVGSFEFQNLMERLKREKVDNYSACQIHHILKEVQKGRDQITAEFKSEILEKFAKKDEAGKIISESPEQPYDVADENVEAYKEATEAFGKKDIEVNWTPLNHQHLTKIQLSADDINLLGELFSEEMQGPGIPQMAVDHRGNVQPIR
jgi:hypothetical protein